jgi:hypothetical protein
VSARSASSNSAIWTVTLSGSSKGMSFGRG